MTDQAKSVEQLQRQVVALGQELADCRVALQEHDLRYRALLYNLPEKVFHKDRDSVYVSCNQNYAADFGITPEQIVGKTDYDLYAPEIAEKYRADDRRIMALGKTEEIKERYAMPTEKESVVRTLKAAIKDESGDVTGILGIFSDITARKQAEAAIQESEERFHKVFEEGPLGVVLLGMDACIRDCNRRFCEMLGYSKEEIIALGLVGISHPEDWEKDFQFGSRLLRGEIPTYTIDKRYVHKGGTVFWGQLTVSMMHDAEGKPTAIIGMIEDISERKRAEESLRNSERTLRALIDASPESMMLLDTEGTVLITNDSSSKFV